jgi:hypothetical protein
MINLLQENREIESPRTNSSFGFCPHTGTKKTKRAIFLPIPEENCKRN